MSAAKTPLGAVRPDIVRSGPQVTLTLPECTARMMIEAIRRYVPASTGVDEALIGELLAQLDGAEAEGRQ